MRPKPVRPPEQMTTEGYMENWICYKSAEFSAKELTVLPGATVTVRDAAAYGLIMMQGHGKMGVWDIETPSLIRYGQLTCDEFFVTEDAARSGVRDRQSLQGGPDRHAQTLRAWTTPRWLP